MKKIEDKQQRNIAFAKRKSGILKKAYELSTLCDVQIALILFSPSGKLFIYDAKTRYSILILFPRQQNFTSFIVFLLLVLVFY